MYICIYIYNCIAIPSYEVYPMRYIVQFVTMLAFTASIYGNIDRTLILLLANYGIALVRRAFCGFPPTTNSGTWCLNVPPKKVQVTVESLGNDESLK